MPGTGRVQFQDDASADNLHEIQETARRGRRIATVYGNATGSASLALIGFTVSQVSIAEAVQMHRKESKGASFCAMPVDIYGDTIASIFLAVDVFQNPQGYSRRYALWLVTSFLLFIMNAIFQLGLSWILLTYAIGEKEQTYEAHNLDEFVDLLVQSRKPLPGNHQAIRLCSMNEVELVPVYLMVVFLWYSRIVTEVGDSLWLAYVIVMAPVVRTGLKSIQGNSIFECPSLRSGNANDGSEVELEEPHEEIIQCHVTESGELFTIMRVPRWCKPCILALVILPKLLISLIIAHLGARFLEYTDKMEKLVLKIMTCVFFVTIDEILCKAFVSIPKQKRLSNMAMRYKALGVSSSWWVYWGSSCCRIFVVLLATLFSHFVEFGSLHRFRTACLDYGSRFPGAYRRDV